MPTTCVICGSVIESGITCPTDRCFNEFKNRREIALSRIRATEAMKIKRNGGRTKAEITLSILRAVSQVLLERDIPKYTSNVELDNNICAIDPSLSTMTQQFRRSQITNNMHSVYYCIDRHSGRGKPTFILVENKEVVRRKLESFVAGMSM
jgi:hypothetical protein